MNSVAVNVSDDVSQVEEPWRPTVERLRTSCREELPGYKEVMAFGMPTDEVGGSPEIAFAKQARYLSRYIMKPGVLDAHRAELRGLNVGKECVRDRRPDQIDWSLVGVLLRETAESAERPC